MLLVAPQREQYANPNSHLEDNHVAAHSVLDELKTPITHILNLINMVYTNGGQGSGSVLNQQGQEMLGSIQRSGFHALEVIEQLGHLYELKSGKLELKPQFFDPFKYLSEIFVDAKPMFHTKPDVRFCLILPSELPPLFLDPTKFRQVIINLIVNASKFTLTGEVVLGACLDETELCIFVQDTGCGVSEEEKKCIFDPYVRGENSTGMGIGLTLVREYMHAFGGSVSFESKEHIGSIFRLHFPR
jgi:signal transduction histidine kinase